MLVYIQVLRFIAATAVVAFHAWSVAPNFIKVVEGSASYGLEFGGNGVDLFFVISGFIIYYATHRSTQTAKIFLQRRLERIVPLYYFIMIAVITLAFLSPTTFDTPGWFTPQHIVKSFLFVSFTDGVMPIVYLGWSLEYEMYFYLCVALLMALTADPWRAVIIVFSAFTVIGQLPGVVSSNGSYGFFVNPLVMEFTIGVLVSQVFVKGRVGRVELGVAGAAFVVLLAMDPVNRAIVFGIPSAILVGAAALLSVSRSRPSWFETKLARLGDASYSIYLAQVNTVSIASMYIAKWVPDITTFMLVSIVTAIGIIVGLALNVFVERPLLKMCRALTGPGIRASAA